MKQLWAPWRLSYIASDSEKKESGCFLCRYRDSQNDAENFVVSRTESCLVVLNRYPYNNGHLLIAPREHLAELEDLDDSVLLECVQQIKRMTNVLKRTINPQGFNVGLNLGAAAGAGLPGHLHWHIVPRWNGDTNFMSVIDDVTVIPQSLNALYDLLTTDLARENANP
ncbi:MAG: HIT domain-containing protein [Planctomycetaceae bacterium]